MKKWKNEEESMKKRFFIALLMAVLAMTFCLAGCGNTEKAPADEPGEAAEEEGRAG